MKMCNRCASLVIAKNTQSILITDNGDIMKIYSCGTVAVYSCGNVKAVELLVADGNVYAVPVKKDDAKKVKRRIAQRERRRKKRAGIV